MAKSISKSLVEAGKEFSDSSEKLSEILTQISETRKDIQSAVAPKFVEVSTQAKDLIELAVEVWRLENRLNKVLPSVQEAQKEAINNSIQKIKRYLDKNDIEILDHTNQKFNDGRNLDIIAVEKDSAVKESIIKETKEPTIMLKGQVVRKGKIIVLANEEQSTSEVENG